jgi:subtilisin family serine protease|tara:strand:+ start:1062 stop:2891 length:1830 start_codon:yes stop_codon:yes gene_type:complete
MRVLVAMMVSIMLCLQPMMSLNDESGNYTIVSFSSFQEVQVDENWWENTRMDMDKNSMHDMLDIALEQGKYVVDGKISILVDFDHMPTELDEQLLIDEVSFEPSWRFHHIPIIAGTIEITLIDDLLDVEGVVFLTLNGEMRMALDNAIGIHHVDTVWDFGYTGEGISIAIIDTGIDPLHVGLNDFDDDPTTNDPKVVAFYDALDESGDDGSGETEAYDDQGHGSHCAGISAGTGSIEEGPLSDGATPYRGVAPDAWLVGVKVLDSGGSGSFAEVMKGMEWTIDNKIKYNIRAASMSLGGVWLVELTQEQEERITHLANEMVAAGISLMIAAGNSAGYGTIGTPGAAKDVITVGSTEDSKELAVYSSKGPTHEGQIKPNVAAIGSAVMSVEANSGNGYASYSGTSMATPMVAGMAALLLQANPDLQPLMVRTILESTSEYKWLSHPVRPNNDYGWGFVLMDAALEEAIQYDASLSINISADTSVISYEGNETDSGNDTASRFYVSENEKLYFDIEGNASHIEWRDIIIEDIWHSVDSLSEIDVMTTQLGTGNHTIWVRAVSSEGISAPVTVALNIGDAIYSEKEDSPSLPFGFVIFTSMMVALYKTRRIE